MESKVIYKRSGLWWNSMGFTKTHIIGVFLTEAVLGIAGAGVATAAMTDYFEDKIPWLLVAVCLFLLQLGVLLSSVLSLLFYIGSRLEASGISDPNELSEFH